MKLAYEPLDRKGCLALAEALGESPETVISVHRLRNGFCRAYVAGDPSQFSGAIIQDSFLPAEPTAYGSDPEILWELLKFLEGWDCVNVALDCGSALGLMMERNMGTCVRYLGDVYHALYRPAIRFHNEVVRQLTLADLKLLESAPEELQGAGFDGPRDMLTQGIAACAIVSGRIAAIAHTSARTERYADIGVFTAEKWRRRGYSTAAVSIVAQSIQEAGQIPTWSAGESNSASLRVAHKVGFVEVGRRVYVIPQK